MRQPGTGRYATIASTTVLCLLVLTRGWLIEAQEAGLFAPVGQRSTRLATSATRSNSAVEDPATIRHRLVGIDFGQLRIIRTAGTRGAALTLNLFDDAVYSATVERVTPTTSGYVMTGRLNGVPLGTLTLVVNGSVVAGTVRSPAATYTIRSADNGLHVIREVDLSRLTPEAEPWSPAPGETNRRGSPEPDALDPPPPLDGAGMPRAAPPAGRRPPEVRKRDAMPASPGAATRANTDPVAPTRSDDGSVIDVLVFYTPAARAFAGGTAEIEALIDLRVTETNQAYADSGVIQRINLVFREEVDFSEASNIQMDLNRLTSRQDGYADEIHALRDVYAADLVHLFEDRDVSDGTGVAWDMREVSHAFAAAAFSVSNVRAENLIFAHELGHNMGLNHDRFEQHRVGKLAPDHADNNKPYPYSYGYVNQRMFEPHAALSSRWRTIMAYSWQCSEQLSVHCPPILRFSNADQTSDGDPLGVPGDAPSSSIAGPSDAQRSLDQTRMTVANFRPSSDRTTCTYRLTPDRQLALADGGTFRVEVTTRPGCIWTAASNDPFLSVTSAGNGAGRGTVTYSATANSGARRSGTLNVAGRRVAVNQIGPNTPGICTRTQQVHEAVVRHRRLDHCWEVTDAHLAFIKRFGTVGAGLTSLQASDLAGFTNLEELHLRENHLTELPADIFSGSRRLRYISLSDNRLEALPAGIFAGLADLDELWLTSNRLTTLPEGIFSRLNNLKVLSLNENRLTSLPAGVFSGLANLEKLFLGYNRLTALATSAFAGLSRLTTLWLHNNRLAALPPGAFSGLTGLEDLTLSDNRIATLPAGIFAGLSSLERLALRRNRLTAIPADSFADLVSLKELALGQNGITALPVDAFVGLVSLEELSLVSNGIAELPAVTGLVHLKELRLYDNRLAALPPDAFSGLASLERLYLSGNELTSLPAGLFAGLGNLRGLTLYNNPGAPFPLTLRLERTAANVAAPGRAAVAVGVDQGAPFEMRVNVSAAGGVLSATGATVGPGSTESDPIMVTQTVAASVTVRLGEAPVLPAGFRGMSTRLGPPLLLFENGPPTVFTDHPIQPEVTPVRSIHFLELRARIDALRGREGLAALGWTDPELIPGVTPVKLAHLTELRKALDEAYVAGGQSPPSWTDADATAGAGGIRAVQLMELRDAVVALELSDASRTPSSR